MRLTAILQYPASTLLYRAEGDWTTAFAKALGCQLSSTRIKTRPTGIGSDFATHGRGEELTPLSRTLPKVRVDGPFGTASEDFCRFETILLVGAYVSIRYVYVTIGLREELIELVVLRLS